MTRRKILGILTILTAIFGIVFAAVPFVGSMNPNEMAKSKAKVRVEISEIPDTGALEIDYQWYKALVVKNPEMAVFVIPHYDGSYRLPDSTWERAFVPCNNFIINAEGFACEDSKLHESWNEEARWNLKGNNKGNWMPDLEKINFRIQGKHLILSPEYK